ncbi:MULTISPECIES: DUF2752 domain-containing protein [unclassified Polaribacter]|uniref:DUF2752 domain-containing protein n=1 Tax=unclassified Polaribacter TaxID=196858 RepID=UPI000068C9BD|nr:DUF2752 domain-containing protein [Polaribacter sp. MED152]EAQ41224.1 hypothetical protein MED152_00880 [Polaribacter sp. MED152]
MFQDLESYMLPCFSKTFLDIECLGCGLQRSFLLFLNGNFFDAFKMYPAIFTLILLISFAIFNFFKKIKNANKIIGRLAYINLTIIIINYLIKISI